MSTVHSVAAEQRVLSFLDRDGKEAMQLCALHGISEATFHEPNHQRIFAAASVLNARGLLLPESQALAEEVCRRQQTVSWEHFAEATKQNPMYGMLTVELPALCRELRRFEGVRLVQRKNAELADAIKEGDQEKAVAAINAMQQTSGITKQRATWQQTGTVELERAESVISGKEDPDVRTLPWPWRALDIDLKPFRRGESVVVAGYTSNGKSSMLRQIALHHARKGFNVAFVSLEVPAGDVFNQIVSAHCGQPWHRLKTLHAKEQAEFVAGAREVKSLPIAVLDNSLSLSEIIAWVRNEHAQRFIDTVAIDYLGLVSECTPQKGQTKAAAVGEVAAAFKRLAVELQCVVLLAVQINRGPTSDGNREPKLSDLKDSGDIEAHADRVELLYRPDRDKINECQQATHDLLSNRPRFYMEIFQEKGRNAGTGYASLWLRRELARFELIAA